MLTTGHISRISVYSYHSTTIPQWYYQ